MNFKVIDLVIGLLFLIFSSFLLEGCTKDRVLPELPPPSVGEETVLANWNFNSSNTPEELMTASFAVNSGFLRFYGNSSELDYCNGDNISCFEEVNDGAMLNLLEGDAPGTALRLRNPCSHLDIHVNSSGYADLKLSYACRRTGSGAQTNEILYSTDGVTFGSSSLDDNVFTVTEEFEVISIDLSNVQGINNNPNAVLRIQFSDGNSNSSGNNRLDNMLILAKEI